MRLKASELVKKINEIIDEHGDIIIDTEVNDTIIILKLQDGEENHGT